MAPGESPPPSAPAATAQAQVVVGLDLGTAFSGFAYAHTADPGNIFTFYDWPAQVQGGGQPYCKTPTSLYYAPPPGADGAQPEAAVEAREWGWPARVRYRADVQAAELRAEGSSAKPVMVPGYLVEGFTARLARGSDGSDSDSESSDGDQSGASGGGGAWAGLVWEAWNWVRGWLLAGRFAARVVDDADDDGGGGHGDHGGVGAEIASEERRSRLRRRLRRSSGDSGSSSGSDETTSSGSSSSESETNDDDDDDTEDEEGRNHQYHHHHHHRLPPGVTARRAVSDYLRLLAEFVRAHLRRTYGTHLDPRAVRWCLAVPPAWSARARRRARRCAQRAGLVRGARCPRGLRAAASRLPLLVVLQSEAAAAYAARCGLDLAAGSGLGAAAAAAGGEVVVADVGAGGVRVAVHAAGGDGAGGAAGVVGELLRRREVEGVVDPDRGFLALARQWLGEGLPRAMRRHPAAAASLLRQWEAAKRAFDGGTGDGDGAVTVELPRVLARLLCAAGGDEASSSSYAWSEPEQDLTLTAADVAALLDPAAATLRRLLLVLASPTTTHTPTILVGGPAGSPYLPTRLLLPHPALLHVPPDPGSAASRGAAALALLHPPRAARDIAAGEGGAGGDAAAAVAAARCVCVQLWFRGDGVAVAAWRENFGDTEEVVQMAHAIPFCSHAGR